MIDNPSDIFETAQEILEEIEAIYGEYEGVAAPLPERRYVAVGGQGSQPHDCEQVTVSMEQFYVGLPGQPSQTPANCSSPTSGVFFIEVVRQTAIIEQFSRRGGQQVVPPTPEQETEFAQVQMMDARLLVEAGMRIGDKFIGAVADVSAGPESGGYQAMVMTLIAPITGQSV